ncbi:MAG: hypothetical protein AB8F94_08015 [Saprospiraceae bacterium]
MNNAIKNFASKLNATQLLDSKSIKSIKGGIGDPPPFGAKGDPPPFG